MELYYDGINKLEKSKKVNKHFAHGRQCFCKGSFTQ